MYVNLVRNFSHQFHPSTHPSSSIILPFHQLLFLRQLMRSDVTLKWYFCVCHILIRPHFDMSIKGSLGVLTYFTSMLMCQLLHPLLYFLPVCGRKGSAQPYRHSHSYKKLLSFRVITYCYCWCILIIIILFFWKGSAVPINHAMAVKW